MFQSGNHDKTRYAEQYICGLLQAERPNMERMEEAVPDTAYQNVQQFISDSSWDHRAVMDRISMEADRLLGGHAGSCLLLDETAFAKSGKKSAGVSRQYGGALGKVDNCQIGVCASLSVGDHVVPVDMRLFLPQCWADEPDRCRAAGVPEDEIKHQPKPEMALEMVRHRRQLGTRFECVCADALYGHSQTLLRALDDDGERFACDVHCNTHVYFQNPSPYVPDGPTGGRPRSKLRTDQDTVRVDDYCETLADDDFEEVELRKSVRGPLRVKLHSRDVWLWDGKEETPRHWRLLIRKELDSSTVKYVLCNDTESTSLHLARLHAQRYWIERSFEDAKSHAGMAAYQTRKWQAWHHHMALVMLTMLFMTEQRMLHRETEPLLSCSDIRILLARFLPRRDFDKQEMLRQMRERHRKRQAAMEGADARAAAKATPT